MLSKRDYWTVTSLIIVIILLFQLINVARRNENLDDIGRAGESVTQQTEDGLPAGDEDK